MEFRILGSLEVWHDGNQIDLPGRNVPKLLAMLLLDAGRAVSIHRLATGLWDMAPPNTATRQIQNSMASLRRRLPSTDHPVLESVGHGYRLTLHGHWLDSVDFEALISQARTIRRTNPHKALRLFNEALALWRGDVLEEFPDRIHGAATARLTEARLSAVEDRIDLNFNLHRHSNVIGELHELVEQNPYRQRLAAQLMRSLHHSGRTAEALQAYAILRQRLAADLGIDPEPEITELHTTILRSERSRHTREPPNTNTRQDARPNPTHYTTTTGRRHADHAVPAQLPAPPATFVGRANQLSTLDRLVQEAKSTARIAAVTGMAGVGKTAFSVRWAHQVRERFSDGQLYINLRGFDPTEPVTPLTALERLLNAFGQRVSDIPTNVDDAAALYRSLLADRRVLVLLDNARDTAQVQPLLPGSAGNLTLVTSRDRLAGLTALDDALPVRLDPLNTDESLELLANVVGASRLHEDPQSSHELASRCGSLPLGLRIAAANILSLPDRPLAEFVAELKGPDRLERLSVRGDTRAAVTATFDLSFCALDPMTQRLFSLLSTVPGDDFPAPLAAALVNHPEEVIADQLRSLESANLIEQYRPGRYRFHDLLREYALTKATRTIARHERKLARTRFIEWHFRHPVLLPSTEGVNVMAALDTWQAHPETWKLATRLHDFRSTGFRPADLLRRCEIQVDRMRIVDDPQCLSLLFKTYASLLRDCGQPNKSIDYSRHAVDMAMRTPEGDVAGKIRGNLGIQLMDAGRLEEAERVLSEAVQTAIASKQSRPIAVNSGALSDACRTLGKYQKAESIVATLLKQGNLPPRLDATVALHLHLARLHLDMGRWTEAMTKFGDTLRLSEEDADARLRIVALIYRADLHRRIGQFHDAHRDLTGAFNLIDDAGRTALADEARLIFAHLLSDEGSQDDASAQLEMIADPEIDIGADVLMLQCLVQTRQQKYEEAISRGRRARDLYMSIPKPLYEARTLTVLADGHDGTDNPVQAQSCRQAALDIFTRIGHPEANEVREALGK